MGKLTEAQHKRLMGYIRLSAYAEILEDAANNHLAPTNGASKKAVYSCLAIQHAIAARYKIEVKYLLYKGFPLFCEQVTTVMNARRTLKAIQKGLTAMGLKVNSFSEFSEFPNISSRQQARYAWLMFAAMIAREQAEAK
jgi:hypothetical protein